MCYKKSTCATKNQHVLQKNKKNKKNLHTDIRIGDFFNKMANEDNQIVLDRRHVIQTNNTCCKCITSALAEKNYVQILHHYVNERCECVKDYISDIDCYDWNTIMINVCNKSGDLNLAFFVLKKLKQYKAYVDWSNLLCWACESGHLKLISYLFKQSKHDEEDARIYWNFILFSACSGGHIDVIQLWEKIAKSNYFNLDWTQGFRAACRWGKFHVALFCFKKIRQQYLIFKSNPLTTEINNEIKSLKTLFYLWQGALIDLFKFAFQNVEYKPKIFKFMLFCIYMGAPNYMKAQMMVEQGLYYQSTYVRGMVLLYEYFFNRKIKNLPVNVNVKRIHRNSPRTIQIKNLKHTKITTTLLLEAFFPKHLIHSIILPTVCYSSLYYAKFCE